MTEETLAVSTGIGADPSGLKGVVTDWSHDKQAFQVPWGKAMMWIFLLSDTFIFSCFLLAYMNVRMTTTVAWPNPSEVFALSFGGEPIPLILIAIMTFVLITSSGTMALAVNYGYRKDKKKTVLLMLATAALGATFVSMQAFEWTKLIMEEGVRPWGNPMGAAQFGSAFFMITGFHGAHVTAGVIYLIVIARRVGSGYYDHWYPKITGRMLNDRLGRIHFWATLFGTYAIYLPMHYLGILGLPRRYYAMGDTSFIPDSAQAMNAGISIAALFVAMIQLIFLFNLFWSYFKGKPSGNNPWKATTLEWQTPQTPPVHGNWGPELPVVYRWAYDYSVPGAEQDYIPQTMAPQDVPKADAGYDGGEGEHS